MRRLERSSLSVTVWAAIGIGLLVLALLIGFGGTGSVTGHPFQLKAAFTSDAQLKPRAQVRVAGVTVGTVTSVEPIDDGSNASVATMELEDSALPIYSDATATVRSRLVFEGNFYVALDPGTPGGTQMDDGDTIGVDRTTGPVQLDRVLSDLPTDTRNNFRTVIQGLGDTLTQTEEGTSTAEALNSALDDAPGAFHGIAEVMSGLQGEEPNDLSNLVQGANQTFSGFARSQSDLANLVSNFNTTMAATASRQEELSRSVELLDPVVHNADRAFTEVERALPDTVLLANELTPAMRELPSTINAMTPWLSEATALLGPDEAGGLTKILKPTVRNTARLVQKLPAILKNVDAISRCWSNNILPTGDIVINDPPQPAGPTAAQEFFQGFTGFVSATQNFDSNGRYARAQTAGGAYPVQTANLPGFGISRANAVLPPLGTRPAFPNKKPPIDFNTDCASNALPNVNGAATGGTP